MKIYVILASGQYTQTINGTSQTGGNVELIAAFTDYQKALDTIEAGAVDVKEPAKWGERAIYVDSVEVDIPNTREQKRD